MNPEASGLADFLLSFYSLNYLLNHATNLVQQRCPQLKKKKNNMNENI
ncbi:hypothetical protein P700755_002957 [Psychroflexus torquis ATCC 700755]|uniref:Uncharacterized protein n=1 Tax=Psychroflexus torquis (strain ATCC 700755 / CIP 106069 / ACAM 623) TaxID=313595 RepID=K4IKN7_PSYTT|nr:hypothetical protein P700755_002957 [Psychroflexus torquis ATCC 700755]